MKSNGKIEKKGKIGEIVEIGENDPETPFPILHLSIEVNGLMAQLDRKVAWCQSQ